MRRRIVAAMTTVVVLAVLVFALPLAVALDHRQQDQDRRELTQLAAVAASRVQGVRLGAPLPTRRAEREQRVGLYDRGGHRVDGAGPPVLEGSLRGAFQDRIIETRIRGALITVVPVGSQRGVDAVVRATEPLSTGRSRVHEQWRRLALLAVLTDAIAAVGALALARRLTRPLASLVGDAIRIGDGDFTAAARRTGLPEVDQVAEAMTNTAARVNDLIAREQAFTADASHQLRSPLAALRVTVEGELAHPRPDPAEALGQALGDIERLEQTIDELLALARETTTRRTPVDLQPSLEQLRRRWQVTLATSGRRLLATSSNGMPPARVSEAAISHVLDVLLSNANDHGAGDVVIATRTHHGALSITVADHGPGVQHPGSLFLRRQPGAHGAGIGLALARRLVEAEGGRLTLARNGPPETMFEVTLPLDDESS